MPAIEDSSTSRAVNMLDAALSYAKAGYAVFPCHYPIFQPDRTWCSCGKADCTDVGKHPSTVHGFKDAATDEVTITRWWKDKPQANIGLPIPLGRVVIDIDGPEGLQVLRDQGYALSATSWAKSGRPGAMHLWYDTDVHHVAPKGHLFPSVDLRGPGSYVIAPPSMHREGKRYEWQQDLLVSEIAAMPDWLLPNIRASVSTGQGIDAASVLEGVAEGDRDTTLFKFASKMRRVDIPYDAAVELVLQAAGKCVPPFPERLAIQKVQSAYGRYIPTATETPDGYRVETLGLDHVRVTARSPHGDVLVEAQDIERAKSAMEAEVTIRLLLEEADTEEHTQRINLLSASSRDQLRRELDLIYGKQYEWAKLLSRSFTRIQKAYTSTDRTIHLSQIAELGQLPWLIEGRVPEGRATIIFGEGSSTKTWQVLYMELCIALGMPWLGCDTKQRTVIHVDGGETKPAVWRQRVMRLALAMGVDIDDPRLETNLLYFPARGMPLSDLVHPLKQIVAKRGGPTECVLAIDHIAALCGGEPEAALVANEFGRACEKVGASVIALAHITGAGTDKPQNVSRPFGSIFWVNWPGQLWYLTRYQGQGATRANVIWQGKKTNDGAPARDFGVNVFFNDPDGSVHIVTEDTRAMPQAIQPKRGVRQQIEACLFKAPEPLTYLDISEITGISRNTVEVTLKREGQNPDSPFVRVEATKGGTQVTWTLKSKLSTPSTPLESTLYSGTTEYGEPSTNGTVLGENGEEGF